jgi:hypothetical protein
LVLVFHLDLCYNGNYLILDVGYFKALQLKRSGSDELLLFVGLLERNGVSFEEAFELADDESVVMAIDDDVGRRRLSQWSKLVLLQLLPVVDAHELYVFPSLVVTTIKALILNVLVPSVLLILHLVSFLLQSGIELLLSLSKLL